MSSLKFQQDPKLEFSRILKTEILEPATLYEESFEATLEEREKLARRFDVPFIELFKVDLTFIKTSEEPETLHVSGTLRAKLTQQCVISLKDFGESLESAFAFEATDPRHIDEEMFEEDEEPPEPLTDCTLDVGEVLAQILALEINPYPKSPDAELETANVSGVTVNAPTIRTQKPFANLSKLLQSGSE